MIKANGVSATTVNVPYDNDGTLQVDTGTVAVTDDFANYLAATRTLSRGSYILKGTFRFPGADVATNAATVVLDGAGSQITDSVGANGLRRLADNAAPGDLTFTNGRSAVTSVPFRNHGRLALGRDSAFTSTGNYEQAAGSTLLQAATSALTATGAVVSVTGGSLAGIGTAGPAVTASGGEVAPGLSAGVLRASGSYAQTASGALRVEIGGHTAGTDFDQLAVTGAAALNGTLRIETINGFIPAEGDRFRIVTAGSRTGEFLSLVGADLGGGLGYTADYDSTGVSLVISTLSVSIGDTSVNEGDTGTTNASFDVTLPAPRTQPVIVDYATADGTAVAPADYAAASGTVTFAPGETTKTIPVAVKGDALDENAETFFVNLSNAGNATIAKGQGVATVTDNDLSPSLSISDAEVPEGDAGTTAAVFTVSLAPASGRTVSVAFATAAGTATSPADFAPATGSITFEPGETTKQVVVQVKGDNDAEGEETFVVDLSAAENAVLGDGRAHGRILDDDLPSLTIADTAVTEGNTGADGKKATFTVSLSPAATAVVTVRYTSMDGTAAAGVDYEPASGTVTFAPGQTSAELEVQMIEDTTPEPDERFVVALADPVNAAIGDGQATGLIVDDGDATGKRDFQLLISPQDQVLSPGESVTYEIVVLGLFGCDEPVALEVLPLPAGVTAEFSQSQVVPDGTSTLTVMAGADVELGDYELVVRATGCDQIHELRTSWSLNFGLTPICPGGGIDGFVTEEKDTKFGVVGGSPIEGVEIGNFSPPLLTDSNGHFDRQGIPPGEYHLNAAKRGWWSPALSTPVTVTCGRTERVNFELLVWRPAVVLGTVVEGAPDAADPEIVHPTGPPIEGANVLLPFFANDDSAADGTYRIEIEKLLFRNQPIVGAHLQARADGYWSRPSESIGGPLSSPIPIGDIDPHDEIVANIPLVKKCTGSVSGEVIDQVTRQPVVGARIEVLWPIEELSVTTGGTGEFTYPGVLLGYNNTTTTRSVSAFAAGYESRSVSFPMERCGATPEVQVELELLPSPIFGGVEGHVYDSVTGAPLAGADVFIPGVCSPLPATECTKTDAQGFYSLPAVPLLTADRPWEIALVGQLAGYYPEFTRTQVSANQTTTHDILLIKRKYARLTGTIRDRLPPHEPIPNARVRSASSSFTVVTEPSGRYLTGDIDLPYPNAPSSASIEFVADGYWPQERSAAVFAEQTSELDFDLLPICDPATVEGTVKSGASPFAPIANALVFGGSPRRETRTNAAGAYTLDGLQVGTNNTPLDVEITAAADGFLPKTTPLTIFCGARLTINGKPRASIIVRKETVPTGDPQRFEFTPSFAGSFSLAGGESKTFSGLWAGSGYAISEAAADGWTGTVTCDDGSPPTNITLSATETVTCTFRNERVARGAIVVRKETLPDGSTQSFDFATSAPDSDFSLKDGESRRFENLEPKAGYSITETVPEGWEQTGASCDDGSPVGNIDLAAGETVTCTFTNTKTGSIVVRKLTLPSPDTSDTSFTISAGGGLSSASFALKNGESRSFEDLAPKAGYSLAESEIEGWDPTSATCDDGSPIGNIDVAPGETVTCTFTNTKRGTIVLRKQTLPAGSPASFTFTPSWGPAFSLKHDESDTSVPLRPGSGYSVGEALPPGWDQTGATCDDGSPVTNIDLAPGETVTCTFANTQRGTVVVKKETLPVGSPDGFVFTATYGPAFTLKHGESNTSALLRPGSGYGVAESSLAGWDLTSATCDDGSPVGNIDVAPGETVTCTFTNTKRGTIAVRKQTFPAGSSASFTFTTSWGPAFPLRHGESKTSASLPPGSGYSVGEALPPGWDQTGATCDDGSPVTRIDLAPGENVTCTFTNTQRGTIVVRKLTVPPSAQAFAFTSSYGSGFSLRHEESNTSAPLPPGSGYSVGEVLPVGWDQTSATCDDGSPVGNIGLSAGETVTCTFTNGVFFAPGGGAFVIGDGNSAIDTAVTFWGAQWWKLNTVSGGTAPAAFKGFAKDATAPTCGTDWSTDPGNSAPPPPGPLPSHMAVIVTSSTGKSGPPITGNTPHIVIVRTNAGYSPNPGHEGTGTVVATVC
ncbi:MAG TPA: Calx-beta domain-containing protein [Gaiellaceae bacterium]|nr:Calx-beta domain-containing protein [Gaiellaceae bacterium]